MTSTQMDISELPTNDSDVAFLREVVKDLMSKQEYQSALFWADKISCLSDFDVQDVLIQARCLYHLKEYHRAIHFIKSRNLHATSLACRHLVAKCHFMAKESKEAFDVISMFEGEQRNQSKFGDDTNKTITRSAVKTVQFSGNQTDTLVAGQPLSEEDRKWKSSLALLKGQIYEANDNRSTAADCFKEALTLNIFNYEAFQSLVKHQMLSLAEEEALLTLIPPDHKLTKFLYSTLLKKYSQPSNPLITNMYNDKLHNNVDILTAKAEGLYYNCDYYACLKVTNEVLEKDLYNPTCLTIHISCLMELQKVVELFGLAHKLVDLYPESPISWHSVGCYYLMVKKTDAARRYLSKATTLEPVFGPSWLLYGHSFAVESEHDQAMAAYFKASHLMKGCHLPLLYIGLEYGVTDNTKLAERFFNQALVIAPNDPFVLHELGVVAFQNGDYLKAESFFCRALAIIKYKEVTKLPEKWEPLLNNMGHVLRKLKRFEESLEFHKQALILSPQNPSTYSAIGFVFALMTKWTQAVDYFHKSLGLRREDQFSTQMLSLTIDHLINSMTPLREEDPPYESMVTPAPKSSDPPAVVKMEVPSMTIGVITRRRRKSGLRDASDSASDMDVSNE